MDHGMRHAAAHCAVELALEALETAQKLPGLLDGGQQPLQALPPELAGFAGLRLVGLAPLRDRGVGHGRQVGSLREALPACEEAIVASIC